MENMAKQPQQTGQISSGQAPEKHNDTVRQKNIQIQANIDKILNIL